MADAEVTEEVTQEETSVEETQVEISAEQKRIAELEEELKATTSESVARRHRIKELEKLQETEDEARTRQTREEAEAEALAKYKPIVVRSVAVAALSEAGATSGLDSLFKLIDQSVLEVEADGSVTGLDAEIARIKTDFPVLFEAPKAEKTEEKPARRAPAARMDGGDKTPSSTTKSASDILASQALGR